MPMGSPGCVTRPRRSMAVAGWVLGGFWRSRRGARRRSGRGAATLEPRALLANERRRSESNRRIEVLQTSALPLGYGAGQGKLALALQQLQDVLTSLLGGQSYRALPLVVLHLGIGAVRQEIPRQLHVLLIHHFVQRRPALVLLRVDRRARLDDQLHRLARAAGDRGVDGLDSHR